MSPTRDRKRGCGKGPPAPLPHQQRLDGLGRAQPAGKRPADPPHGFPGGPLVPRQRVPGFSRGAAPGGAQGGTGARTIEEAAALAAYWSKGRSARKVPVVYTRVKHVSKPRGGAPGLAVLRREKTVIVAPLLLATRGTRRV